MKIDFERFGCIDKGSVELNDFTIFCGKNNTGKTYVMYAIYCIFDIVNSMIEHSKYMNELKEYTYINRKETKLYNQENFLIKNRIQILETHIKKLLPDFFGVSNSEFLNTKIKIINNELDGISTFSNSNFSNKKNVFLLPAERNGINTFSKELFSIRNILLQQAQNDSVNPMLFLKDIVNARYPKPIKDYLQFINSIGTTQQDNSAYSDYAQTIQTNVLGGDYLVDEFGNISFTTHENNKNIPLHFSSSTVKSLFGLVFYLKHIAKEGDYLMIDEPELNLHPDNQHEVARILAQLVNAGLKVVVSTHSDYFVRELNNLIMLKNDFAGADALKQKYNYQDNELLDSSKVSAYLFANNTIEKMPLGEEGIVADTFNQVIHELNQSSNEIYYAMQDVKELENW